MKILMINVCCGTGSTGRICTDLAEALEQKGHEVKIAYARDEVPEKYQKYAVKIGNDFDVYAHVLKSRLMDGMGYGSKHATRHFIEWVKIYDPDVIHLHNIHGYYINTQLLFDYLRNSGKKVIWTLHDCWSFTGHCMYFDFSECEKWKYGCHCCIQKEEYPQRLLLDHSERNYRDKKRMITEVKDITFVTPSKWLADLVNQSFLKGYSVKVVNNGIDTRVFHPVETEIKAKYGIENKRIVLGVASVWDKRKGLDDFLRLRDLLGENYVIVLIGLTEKQISSLPTGIIGIKRTNSVNELVEWYSAADVYVNTTYEDNYPTTNLEAIACGTPVVSYNTGGSGESARLYGEVVQKGDVSGIATIIQKTRQFSSLAHNFDSQAAIEEYIRIYNER